MAIYVELRDADGVRVRSLPDPAGGTFDAAGDFDRLIGDVSLPLLGSIDPYELVRLEAHQMAALLGDIAVAQAGARSGPEARGLERLRVLAESCRDQPGSVLAFIGD